MGRKWKQPRPPDLMRKGGAHDDKRRVQRTPGYCYHCDRPRCSWPACAHDIDISDGRVDETDGDEHGQG